MTEAQRQKALKAVEGLKGIIADTVKELDRGMGCPNGPIYAAMMGIIDLHTYNLLLDLLVREGKIGKTTELLYWKGKR